MGVMGFLGDSRGRNSKSPPNPLGLAERVLRTPPQRPPSSREGDRPQAVEGVPRPSPVEKFPFSTPPGSPVGQGLRPCRRLHIGALRSPLLPFAPSRRYLLVPRTPPQRPPSSREGDRPQAVEGVPAHRAPITLRAPSRRVVITSGINGRAMRAPTEYGGATNGCKCI